MSHSNVYLSIDLGASSGRVMAGIWDGSSLQLSEVHRFPSPAVFIPPYHHWDILSIYNSILQGLNKAQQIYSDRIVSIGVDSWGVDYALIDSKGELLANPVQYRDERTQEPFANVQARLGREHIYAETGIQFAFYNTIYQLAAEVAQGREAFLRAEHLLFIPDLINYWLTGTRIQERTIASTTQLMNPHTGAWSSKLIDELGLPARFFGAITDTGTPIGHLRPDLAEELRMPKVQVIAVPSHDTASAVAATPFASPRCAFLSSGTWSIMGQELPAPNTSTDAMNAGFSNELGYGNTVRFLRNICGMWLIEESRRQWAKDGQDYYTHDAIAKMVCEVPARRAFIDPDASEFAAPGNIPARISKLCQQSGQPQPSSPGEILRVAFDSLVMKYRHVFKKLEVLSGGHLERLHIVGGGAKNDFLNQMTADALGVVVEAGPAEATSLGNIAIQMITDGTISDLAAARGVIRRSFPPTVHEPEQSEQWEKEEARFNDLLA